jgi:hypothetical protein
MWWSEKLGGVASGVVEEVLVSRCLVSWFSSARLGLSSRGGSEFEPGRMPVLPGADIIIGTPEAFPMPIHDVVRYTWSGRYLPVHVPFVLVFPTAPSLPSSTPSSTGSVHRS